MNRYPLWKNLIVVVVLIFGLIYTLPNFFGEVPAVQVSSARSTVRVDTALMERIENALKQAGIPYSGALFDNGSVRVKFENTDTQLKAKDIIEATINPDPGTASYTAALNLIPASPDWLRSIYAKPMSLGLDLRGGVHFMLQVDMKDALSKRLDAYTGDIRTTMRSKDIRYGGVLRKGNTVVIRFRDEATREKARNIVQDNIPDFLLTEQQEGSDLLLIGTLTTAAEKSIREQALSQNITTLNNRVNELGVAEPVIQQQGQDRIIVQLPGVQDVARAKDLIGRTATLEVRLVDEAAMASGDLAGTDVFPEHGRGGQVSNIPMKKQVILTGDRFVGAHPTFDENQMPAVSVDLDAAGGRIMRDVTHENINKQMAIVLFEKGQGEAISVATIRGEFGSRFQISGRFSSEEANTLAILIRSGALAAPMEFVEERVIGPSLGAENIEKGFASTLWGFIAIASFMIMYYMMFGLISSLALASNLLILVGLLSLLPTTLTLPGIAAIALTLGMAIDANVLINERIREELRAGNTPQAAIATGYERAFGTILDSNITTLIAGIALFMFASGPVRGFAVVHCLGIGTSMLSAVVISRAMVNFVYGSRRRLTKVSIGQLWKPTPKTA